MTPDEVKELMSKGLITQVIDPVNIVNNMETEPEPCDYQLPIASNTTLGGVKVGDCLNIDNNGKLRVRVKVGGGLGTNVDGALEVNIGSGLNIGGNGSLEVHVGTGLDIDRGSKRLYVTNKSDYKLPMASDSILGGVKLGTANTNWARGLSIGDGILGVSYGHGLYIDNYGRLCASGSDYQLPIASDTTLGGVKIGSGIIIDSDGRINVLTRGGSNYELPIASDKTLGGVKIGTEAGLEINTDGILQIAIGSDAGLEIGADGRLYATGGSDYVLPKASDTMLGGVTIGTASNSYGLSIDQDSGQLVVKCGQNMGVKINNDGMLVADIDYIYQQILTKLKADGYIQ